MFRRKRTQTPAPSAPGSGASVGRARAVLPTGALEGVYMRVLQSFLIDGPPSQAAPHPPRPATAFDSAPSAPPFAGGLTTPPPVNAPGATFAGPLVGGEVSLGSTSMAGSTQSVNIPGLGAVSRDRMKAAEARAQAAIQEALGSTDLSRLTPADVQAVEARLEGMRAQGRITPEQHAALSEGLAVLSQSSPADPI
jgi:hypothetical protein